MEFVYRGYRIAVSEREGFVARITHVRGAPAPFSATATAGEGTGICAERARALIDRYLAFLQKSRTPPE